ncbi:hypothetical protein AAKU58_002047 [Oxalobacteraceae bacterium GrIS 1.18]
MTCNINNIHSGYFSHYAVSERTMRELITAVDSQNFRFNGWSEITTFRERAINQVYGQGWDLFKRLRSFFFGPPKEVLGYLYDLVIATKAVSKSPVREAACDACLDAFIKLIQNHVSLSHLKEFKIELNKAFIELGIGRFPFFFEYLSHAESDSSDDENALDALKCLLVKYPSENEFANDIIEPLIQGGLLKFVSKYLNDPDKFAKIISDCQNYLYPKNYTCYLKFKSLLDEMFQRE